MVQVMYYAGINEDGRGMVESVLCDWVHEKIENEESVLYCYRNGLSNLIAIIKSTDSIIIRDVFEGSEE